MSADPAELRRLAVCPTLTLGVAREALLTAADNNERMAAEINKASVRLNGPGGEVIEVRPLVAEQQTEAK